MKQPCVSGSPAAVPLPTLSSLQPVPSTPPPGKHLLGVLKLSQVSIPAKPFPTHFLIPNTELFVHSSWLQKHFVHTYITAIIPTYSHLSQRGAS